MHTHKCTQLRWASYLILCLFTCGLNAAEVNIYSARKEDLIKPLLQKFEEQTNIKVNKVCTACLYFYFSRNVFSGCFKHQSRGKWTTPTWTFPLAPDADTIRTEAAEAWTMVYERGLSSALIKSRMTCGKSSPFTVVIVHTTWVLDGPHNDQDNWAGGPTRVIFEKLKASNEAIGLEKPKT